MQYLLSLSGTISLGLLLSGPLFELHLTEVEDRSSGLEERDLLLLSETENTESLVTQRHLLDVIDAVDGEYSLVDHGVEAGVGGDQQLLVQLGEGRREELVEDVEVTLGGHLAGHSGLLQQVELNVGSSNLTGGTEVDSDELSLYNTGRDKDQYTNTCGNFNLWPPRFHVIHNFTKANKNNFQDDDCKYLQSKLRIIDI